MDPLWRARLSIALAGVGLIGGVLALVTWRVDFGATFSVDGDTVTIASVASHSPAEVEGFVPGMVVLGINGVQLVTMPHYLYPSPDPNTGEYPGSGPIGVAPAAPTPVHLPASQLAQLLNLPIRDLEAIRPSDLALATADGAPNSYFIGHDYLSSLEYTLGTYVGGAILLLAGAWWLLTGRGGPALRGMAFPLAAAVSLPLLVQPLLASWSAPAIALVGIIVPLGTLPLGLALLERVPPGPGREPIRLATYGVAACGIVLGIFRVWLPAAGDPADALWFVLSAAVALIPGIAAALPPAAGNALAPSGGRLLQSTELAVAGATPAIALVTGSTPFLFPLSGWLVLVLAAGRFTVRPLARLAVRAQLQRDLVVAATEAERARVAADIHDDALQELTMLVRRLDETGDAEAADMARTISDRLRAICGDLRLPILDDLGVGPALDWLVTRIERLAGGEVRLERSDGSRLPPAVELGIFRVAQEALANAVKHGRPPIVVRYHASASGASLSIDDAGPGIEPDAAARAEGEGRFGLLNMQQRAEQIGAILDVRRWPGGGTHVALEWRAR
jgi:signal transduction histidine kinase